MGTFTLVFAGCGAVVVDDLYGGLLGHVGVSLVFGLVVMAMVYAVGNVSGAHLNPAVSMGFYAAGRLKLGEALRYTVSQVVGALLGAGLLRILLTAHSTLGATQSSGSVLRVLGLEVALTFLLMFAILNVSTDHFAKGVMAGVAVGGTVGIAALFGGPVTGASLNPARSLGPASICGHLSQLWMHTVPPHLRCLVGGAHLPAHPGPRMLRAGGDGTVLGGEAGRRSPSTGWRLAGAADITAYCGSMLGPSDIRPSA
jgi:aquaporin Z